MPKIVTESFQSRVFFLPYSFDKKEGVWVKPLSRTKRSELQQKVLLESGSDSFLAEAMLPLKILETCVVDWKGFFDPEGNEIPYSLKVLHDMWEHDTETAVRMASRILDVARLGEIDDRKN